MPVKMIQDDKLLSYIRDGFIPPVHVQLTPTNVCNLKCSFCSCGSRDQSTEMGLGQLTNIMAKLASYGCKSVTITGGGEPLMHPKINDLVYFLHDELKLKLGLVTNGTRFERFNQYDGLTWCRISGSDEREPDWDGIESGVNQGNRVDWAFSYVVTKKPNWERIQRIVDFANSFKFTHVRLVRDLLDVKAVSKHMTAAKKKLTNDGLVIYQDRISSVKGQKQCFISLLKPVIGADGGIYPCCGIQYAYNPPSKDLAKEHRMGMAVEISQIWENQRHYDGSKCQTCYYDDYNSLISIVKSDIKHKEFI